MTVSIGELAALGVYPPAVSPPRIIACASAGGIVYGAVGATAKTLGTTVIKGKSVAPSSLLEVTGFYEFAGTNTSRVVELYIGATKIADAFPDVGINTFQFQTLLWVDPRGKSIRVMDIRLNGTLQPHRALIDSTGGSISSTTLAAITAGSSYSQADMQAVKNAIAQLAARTLGNGSVFRGDNAAKTTYSVDLTADQTLTLKATPASGDTAELIGFTVVNFGEASLPRRSNAASNSLACFGDSLTRGYGATSPAGGWVSQLRIAEAGRPVLNFGVDGETISQIVDRVVEDKVRGRYWNAVIWGGRNDVGVAADLTDVVLTNLERAMAFRADGAKTVIGTITPTTSENDASALGLAIAACNAAIKAEYGGRTAEGIAVADIYTAMATDPGHLIPASRLFDATHFNDTGYGVTQSTFSAGLASIGG